MIQVEYLNDGALIKHYSDTGMLMRQEETGLLYGEAIDVMPCQYTYTETNEPADVEGDEAVEEDYIAALTDIGVIQNDEN